MGLNKCVLNYQKLDGGIPNGVTQSVNNNN